MRSSLPIILTFLLALIYLSMADQACCQNNRLSIIGTGKVQVEPDTASFSVGVKSTRKTSIAALGSANKIMNQVIYLLKKSGIQDSDLSSSINLYAEYKYSNGISTLVGQAAQLSLSVQIQKLDKTQLENLILQLSKIQSVTISGLSFSRKNKQGALRVARKEAFQDAKSKAKDYQYLTSRKMNKIYKILDRNAEYLRPYFSSLDTFKLNVQNPSIPLGKVDLSAQVEVHWTLI